jgi:hypothetical protein
MNEYNPYYVNSDSHMNTRKSLCEVDFVLSDMSSLSMLNIVYINHLNEESPLDKVWNTSGKLSRYRVWTNSQAKFWKTVWSIRGSAPIFLLEAKSVSIHNFFLQSCSIFRVV